MTSRIDTPFPTPVTGTPPITKDMDRLNALALSVLTNELQDPVIGCLVDENQPGVKFYFITDAVKPFRSGEGYKAPLVVNFPNIYTNLTVDGAG